MNTKELKKYKMELHNHYLTKYRTMFRKTLNFEGIEEYEANYIMDNLFNGSWLAAFELNVNSEVQGLIGFGKFVTQKFGMYRQPVSLTILKESDSPLIPKKVLKRHETVAILDTKYRPVTLIKPLLDKLIEVEITINQNLKTHRMPFMVQTTDEKTRNAIENAIDGRTIVEVSASEVIGVLQTGTPYYIDKLYRYKVELENEILTILGVDNVKFEKGAQMNNDEVNANNAEINSFRAALVETVNKWLDEIYTLFGVSISVEETEFIVDQEAVGSSTTQFGSESESDSSENN